MFAAVEDAEVDYRDVDRGFRERRPVPLWKSYESREREECGDEEARQAGKRGRRTTRRSGGGR